MGSTRALAGFDNGRFLGSKRGHWRSTAVASHTKRAQGLETWDPAGVAVSLCFTGGLPSAASVGCPRPKHSEHRLEVGGFRITPEKRQSRYRIVARDFNQGRPTTRLYYSKRQYTTNIYIYIYI